MAAPGKFQLRATGKQVSQFEKFSFPALARSLSGGSQSNDSVSQSNVTDDIIASDTYTSIAAENNVTNENLSSGYSGDMNSISEVPSKQPDTTIQDSESADTQDNSLTVQDVVQIDEPDQNDTEFNNDATTDPTVAIDVTSTENTGSADQSVSCAESESDMDAGEANQQQVTQELALNQESVPQQSEQEDLPAQPDTNNASDTLPTTDQIHNKENNAVLPPDSDESVVSSTANVDQEFKKESNNMHDLISGETSLEETPITSEPEVLSIEREEIYENNIDSSHGNTENDDHVEVITYPDDERVEDDKPIDLNDDAVTRADSPEINLSDDADIIDTEIPASEGASVEALEGDQENEAPCLFPPPPPPPPPPVATLSTLPTPPVSSSKASPDEPDILPPTSPSPPLRYHINLPTPPSTPTMSIERVRGTDPEIDPTPIAIETDECSEQPNSTISHSDHEELSEPEPKITEASLLMVPPPIQLVPLVFRSETPLDFTPPQKYAKTLQENNEHDQNMEIEVESKLHKISRESEDIGKYHKDDLTNHEQPQSKPDYFVSVQEQLDQQHIPHEGVMTVYRSSERIESEGEANILSPSEPDTYSSSVPTYLDVDHQNIDSSWGLPPKLLLVPATLQDSLDESEILDRDENNVQAESLIDADESVTFNEENGAYVAITKTKGPRVTFQSDVVEDTKIDDISDDTGDSGLDKELLENDDSYHASVSRERNDSTEIVQSSHPTETEITDSGTVIMSKNNVISILMFGDAQQTRVPASGKAPAGNGMMSNGDVHDVMTRKDSCDADQQEIRNLRQAYGSKPTPVYFTDESLNVREPAQTMEIQMKDDKIELNAEHKIKSLEPGKVISKHVFETNEVKNEKVIADTVMVAASAQSVRSAGAVLQNQYYGSIKQSPRSSPRLGGIPVFSRNKGGHSVDSKLYGFGQGQSSNIMNTPFSNHASIPGVKQRSKRRIGKSYDDPSPGSTRTSKTQTISSLESSKFMHAYRDTRDVEMISAPMSTIPAARKQKFPKSEDIFMKMPPQFQYYASLNRDLGKPPISSRAESESNLAHRWYRFKAFTKRVFTETGDRFNDRKMVHFSVMKNRKQVYKPQSFV